MDFIHNQNFIFDVGRRGRGRERVEKIPYALGK